MKTPRELLLHRHREVEVALNEVRGSVLRTLNQKGHNAQTRKGFLNTLWQELFVVCRRYWSGLGVAWCVIIGFAAVGGLEGPASSRASTSPSALKIQAMLEQRQLRNELLGVQDRHEARTVHRDRAPGPRSKGRTDRVTV